MRRWYNIFSLALWLIAVISVAEVVVRCLHIKKIIEPWQMILAGVTNFAVLGLAAGLLCAAWAVIARLSTTKRDDRRQRGSLIDICWAAIIFTIAFCTDVCAALPHAWPISLIVALVAGAGACLLSRVARVRNFNGISRSQRVVMVLLWLGCVVLAGTMLITTKRRLSAWLTPDVAESAMPGAKLPNIIVVVLDTLRADRLEAYGGTGLTPVLDGLAKQSLVYRNAISTAPWTLPTHASLFTGTYPWTHRVSWGHFELDESLPTLGEIVKGQGYDTMAISNNWLLTAESGYDRGFDAYIEISSDQQLSAWYVALKCGAVRKLASVVGLPAAAAQDAGSAWTNWLMGKRLQQQPADRPFFAFLNYYEVHDPYEPPQRFIDKVVPKELHAACKAVPQHLDDLCVQACATNKFYNSRQIELLEWLYDAEVAYQDFAMGELIQILRRGGNLENTWLVITSDHGELFGEQHMLHHSAGSHFNLLHVPLVVRPPGGSTPRLIDAPVQPVDVFASVVQWSGATIPTSVTAAIPLPMDAATASRREYALAHSHGASLSALVTCQRRRLQADVTRWLTWQTSIFHTGQLLQLDGSGVVQLYDVSKDPDLEHNLVDTQPERVRALAAKLQEFKSAWR